MYPETDVLPDFIDETIWDSIEIPELLTNKAKRYAKEYGIDFAYASQLVSSEKLPLFESAVRETIKPKLAAFTILSTTTELRREGTDVRTIPDSAYLGIWHAVEDGRAAKEAIPDILRCVASGTSVDEALKKLVPAVTNEELESIVKKIISARLDFVKTKERAALGPLMGLVMAEVRGSVDGKIVSSLLKKEIDLVLSKKIPE
jgi:glutamyl-tRNA(Gln) amidotransferase subunit E